MDKVRVSDLKPGDFVLIPDEDIWLEVEAVEKDSFNPDKSRVWFVSDDMPTYYGTYQMVDKR